MSHARDAGRAAIKEGFTGTLDQLAAYLADRHGGDRPRPWSRWWWFFSAWIAIFR